MARITVTDLPQSDVLDRQAMQAIAGGARSGARPANSHKATPPGQSRILDYPPGFGDRGKAAARTNRS
jgi:hypothetical protein